MLRKQGNRAFECDLRCVGANYTFDLTSLPNIGESGYIGEHNMFRLGTLYSPFIVF